MKIERIIYGNAPLKDEKGWRLLKKSAGYTSILADRFMHHCGNIASESTTGHPHDTFFIQKYKGSLLMAIGKPMGNDGYGRPGAWIFYGSSVDVNAIKNISPIDILTVSVCDYDNWLASASLLPINLDLNKVEPKATNLISSGFYASELCELVQTMRSHSKLKIEDLSSLLFPQTKVSTYKTTGVIMSDKCQIHLNKTRSPFLLIGLILFSLVLVGMLYFGYSYHQKEVSKLTDESATLVADKETLTAKLEKSENNISELKVKYKRLQKEKNKLIEDRKKLKKTIRELKEKLEFQASDSKDKKFAELQKKKRAIETELQQIKKWLNDMPESLKKAMMENNLNCQ